MEERTFYFWLLIKPKVDQSKPNAFSFTGPLATLRKLLLSEESIANLKKFLMRYWYTVIFIVLGVFILMAVIIKVCGKKTPLVRSRRKRRRQTIQHGAEHGSRGIDNPTEVQV